MMRVEKGIMKQGDHKRNGEGVQGGEKEAM